MHFREARLNNMLRDTRKYFFEELSLLCERAWRLQREVSARKTSRDVDLRMNRFTQLIKQYKQCISDLNRTHYYKAWIILTLLIGKIDTTSAW